MTTFLIQKFRNRNIIPNLRKIQYVKFHCNFLTVTFLSDISSDDGHGQDLLKICLLNFFALGGFKYNIHMQKFRDDFGYNAGELANGDPQSRNKPFVRKERESSRVGYCLCSVREASRLTAHKTIRKRPHLRHLGCHRPSGKTAIL